MKKSGRVDLQGSTMAASASATWSNASDAPHDTASASLEHGRSLFEIVIEEDEDEYASEEPHIMAVYQFATTITFEFGFDRAKAQIERDQREGLRGLDPPSAGPKWAKFYSVLSQFAVAEKEYMSAAYLAPQQNKGFLGRALAKEENWLRKTYSSMSLELEKIEILEGVPELVEIASQLKLLVKTRESLMSFYEGLCQSALAAASADATTENSEFMDFEALLVELTKTVDLLHEWWHGCIKPIRIHVLRECQIVGGYISCLAEVARWKYNLALGPMTTAKKCYDRWKDAMKVLLIIIVNSRMLTRFHTTLQGLARHQEDRPPIQLDGRCPRALPLPVDSQAQASRGGQVHLLLLSNLGEGVSVAADVPGHGPAVLICKLRAPHAGLPQALRSVARCFGKNQIYVVIAEPSHVSYSLILIQQINPGV